MFLPGVSLKIKLVGIAVLAVLIFSVVGTSLEIIGQALAEGAGQTEISRDQFAGSLGSQASSEDENDVVSGLKFVCPFH